MLDIWSAPRKADVAFHLSGAVFYSLGEGLSSGPKQASMCLFFSYGYKIALSVLHMYQNICASLSNLHADLIAVYATCSVCMHLASCGLHMDVFDFAHRGCWYQIRLQRSNDLFIFM